jgi:hypothetical protein
MTAHLGLWCTADGRVRQELRADGRYVEARGDGVVVDGVLHHAGMVMRRR